METHSLNRQLGSLHGTDRALCIYVTVVRLGLFVNLLAMEAGLVLVLWLLLGTCSSCWTALPSMYAGTGACLMAG